MNRILVYTTTLCQPCVALKKWLQDEHIRFDEILRSKLDDEELAILRAKILTVSRVGHATLPAVCIIRDDGTERWISNHGDSDVTEMIQEIKSAIAAPVNEDTCCCAGAHCEGAETENEEHECCGGDCHDHQK